MLLVVEIGPVCETKLFPSQITGLNIATFLLEKGTVVWAS
jgi:hypothetical protein